MKRGIVLLLALVAWIGPLSAKESHWPDRIKVLLAEDASGAFVEVKGKYEVVDPRTGSHLSGGTAKCYPIEAQSGGLQWGEGYPDIYQVAILPLHDQTTILVDGIEYRGAILVYEVRGHLYIVNDLPIEEYTKCMLAVAAPDHSLEEEAVAALAIVLRSNACHTALRNRSAHWHVRALEVGYCGDGAGLWSDRYQQMVDRTSGMVLVASEMGGAPIPAEFTGHCAGRTIGYDLMHRSHLASSLKGVDAPLAERSREDAAWSCRISKRRLAQLAGLDQIAGMNLYADDFSGKVYAVRLYDDANICDLDFHTLQQELGSDQLRGSEFVVETTGNQVTFTGYGAGAGVGLCLYSAEALAGRGQDARAILKSFFPHAQIEIK